MSFSLCVTLISYTKVRDKSLPGTNTHTHTKKKMQVYKKKRKGLLVNVPHVLLFYYCYYMTVIITIII